MGKPIKPFLLVLVACLAPSYVQAQSSYVGFQLSAIASSSGLSPFADVQVGGPVADHVELRLSGVPLVIANFLQVDLLYTKGLSEALRGYVGGGADVLPFSFPRAGLGSAVHATAGVEYELGGGIGLFAEAQPTLVLNAPDRDFADFFGNAGSATFFVALALGVNVHF